MSRAVQWLFSYGTLRQPEVQRAVFGRLLREVPDTLEGYELRDITITDPSVIATSGSATHTILRPMKGGEPIAGIALAVGEADLLAADAYEVADYRRVVVTLASERRAFVYVDRDFAGGV